MGQPKWPDGSPIEGVFIDKIEAGVSPSFSLDFDLTFDGSAPPDLLHELDGSFPQFSDPGIGLSYDDAVNLLLCADFADQVIDQLGFEGQFVDDLKTVLACAYSNDAAALAEIDKWSDDLAFDPARMLDALMSIIKEIKVMEGEGSIDS